MAIGTDLIEETRRHLFSGDREELNKLSASIGITDTSLVTIYDLGGIQVGSVIEIGTELLYVWAVAATSKTVTIERAQLGSAAAAHSANDIIRVNPKFPNFAIFKALNEELDDLSSPLNGLFQMTFVDITYNAAVRGYDLTGVTNLLDIYEVRFKEVGADKYWPEITSWSLARNMPTADFPSGLALMLNEGAAAGRTIRVRYKAPFTQLALAGDNLTTTGMHTEMYDIPPLGAVGRLVMPREVKRAFSEHQGEPRRAEEVPPGSQIRASAGMASLRRTRIQAESARLYQRYTPRLKMAR